MRYSYEHNNQTHTLDLQRLPDGRYQVMLDGREIVIQATQLADGGWLLRHEQQQQIAYTASADDQRYVQVDGGRFALTVSDQRRRRRAAGAAGDLTAQMPGQVMAVAVSAGDSVEAGQTLVVLEAMKMEIRVAAPTDGTVQQVHVKAGDVVERGQTLLEISEA